MKLLHYIAVLGLAAVLSGCASNRQTARAVRDFAGESAKLGAFSELTQRYRDTYRREQPYLTPEADQRERQLDAARAAACDDFLAIEQSVVLYMRTLGRLAGDDQYDLSDGVRRIGNGIREWPDSGLDKRHASAYTAIGRLLTRMLTESYQKAALVDMVKEGEAPLQLLFDAMGTLLRYYDKSNANERKIVLGLFDVEIPLAELSGQRLLPVLARAHYQEKTREYALAEKRYTLARDNLQRIADGHRALFEHVDALAGTEATGALDLASQQIRDSRTRLETNRADATFN